MAPLSIEELHLFLKTVREVFCFLIFKLHRNLTQSLLVMALWLWLENIGYPNLFARVMDQPDTIVIALVNEAVDCLKCLEADNPFIPNDGGLPQTNILVQKDVFLRIFNEKSYTAITSIKSVLKSICARIFADILQIILKSTNINKASISRTNTPNRPLVVPGFPHPLFGTFDMPPKTVNMDLSDMSIWDGKRPYDDVTNDDKTMFLTFSKGFPVSIREVKQLFTSAYGDCVQRITMGTIHENDQPLYAIMVLNTVAAVDRIQNGKRIAKHQINGKHIWPRKYEPRNWIAENLEKAN